MRILSATAAIGAALFLGACSSGTISPGSEPAAIQRDDAFLPYVETTSPSVESGQFPADHVRMHLVARRDRTSHVVSTYAVLGIVYAQKTSRRFENARNERAVQLPLRQLAHDGTGCRKQKGCAHLELYQVDIPEADLKAALASGTGYPIKLFARAGAAALFPITKDQVQALGPALVARGNSQAVAQHSKS